MQMELFYLAEVVESRTAVGTIIEEANFISGPYPSEDEALKHKRLTTLNVKVVFQVIEVFPLS